MFINYINNDINYINNNNNYGDELYRKILSICTCIKIYTDQWKKQKTESGGLKNQLKSKNNKTGKKQKEKVRWGWYVWYEQRVQCEWTMRD